MGAVELYEPRLGFFSVAWRLFVAPWLPMFVVAAVLFMRPDLPLNAAQGLVLTLPLTVIIGSVLGFIAVIGGYPLYLFYRRRGWAQWWVYALGGALVPTVICAALASPAVVDPRWLGYLGAATILAPLGAVSGVVFWALLRWRDRSLGGARNVY